ncbi:MAG: carboxypeptidase regulatory-like domain-containing protein, partial [Bacteroidaceae bacterium]|nr:carboxypeptidase regulatory-like domain-containing protein [Bacteroidaceae bacterium]
VIWLPTRDVELCADQTGYRSVEFLPADSTRTIHLQEAKSIRLQGSLQEQIASLPKYVPDEDEVRLLPQGTIGGSPYCPSSDSILYLVNGVPQPKENNKWLGRRSYLDYFKGQHMLVSKVMRHMTDEAKQRYIEKFGEAAKHGVVEYFCVEDTLCDYYMNQHEELKASRRRVSGVVYDENDEPLAHTMINIWHEKRVWGFETTDSLGNFTFWVPRTDVKMEFTYVGFYKPVVVEPSDTFQTIYLLPNDNLQYLRENLKF